MNSKPGNRPERLEALDAARGLCAAFVAVYHFCYWSGVREIESLGTFPVYIFFILSALTMVHAYRNLFEDGISTDGLKRFFANRIARVMPLLAVAALLMALSRMALYSELDSFDLVRFLLTATGAFALHLPGMMSNTIGAWSLAIEFVFYLLFPVMFLLLRGLSTRRMLACIAAMIFLQQATIMAISPMATEDFWFSYATPLIFAPFFMIGFLIAGQTPTRRPVNFWIGFVLICVMGFWSLFVPGEVVKNPVVYLILTVVSGLSIYCFYATPNPEALASVSRFLGNISYPMYLTHFFVYEFISRIFVTVDAGNIAVWLPVFLVMTVGVSLIARRLIEIPGQKVTKRLLLGKPPQRKSDPIAETKSPA